MTDRSNDSTMRPVRMPPPDPRLVPGLLDEAIAAQDAGHDKALDRARAELMRNAGAPQHYFLLQGMTQFNGDMRKTAELMRTAVRLNADLPPEKRITPPTAETAQSARLAALDFPHDPTAATAQSPQTLAGPPPAPEAQPGRDTERGR
ncbi:MULTISPECIES: hypothetical protein [unclassified Streptomyces]|uniref:hypothetical protein n=1 Tax=unclassified Streptomyces TaxID=2593676 RepID=UPI0033DB17B9